MTRLLLPGGGKEPTNGGPEACWTSWTAGQQVSSSHWQNWASVQTRRSLETEQFVAPGEIFHNEERQLLSIPLLQQLLQKQTRWCIRGVW